MRETKETCDLCGKSVENDTTFIEPLWPPTMARNSNTRSRQSALQSILTRLSTIEACDVCLGQFDTLFTDLSDQYIIRAKEATDAKEKANNAS